MANPVLFTAGFELLRAIRIDQPDLVLPTELEELVIGVVRGLGLDRA